MDRIIEHLINSSNVLITSHINQDGDAIGSLLAVGFALNFLNKKTFLFNESSIPSVYRFLPGTELIKYKINELYEFDTAVILDCGNLERIGKSAKTVSTIPVIINIDHHVTNTGYGTCRLVDTSACSTAELVYRIIKKMNIPINKEIATSIYTAILTDTGSFRASNTNGPAFAICEEMIAYGADPYEIAQNVYGKYSLGRIRLLNLALDSIAISDNGKLSMMTITSDMINETETKSEDVDGLISYAKRIKGIKVAVLIQEERNSKSKTKGIKNFHVSLRSDGTIDVTDIALSFGGGGHFSAAGFNLETGLDELKTIIMRFAEKL
ncbi:MAG: bifunctional oligoribonuclease/PAP phosphatase NrnA [Pseudomonadota bacterium]